MKTRFGDHSGRVVARRIKGKSVAQAEEEGRGDNCGLPEVRNYRFPGQEPAMAYL
jgi:hypothetical protein